ncbi:PepSY-associated TM helix domain-containing protein [Neoroseomonas lacus]|uniref:Membrane protein n=1 Tax=Neoroseomonas lacus TaxID=287609 RepID=A0A917L301_9PROT|nr:PepSY-associated TM helix domain-containing protein [Neoroseomonas lacus]GGJ42246.1 membrane protein [Neoroseomonas lacus]
MTRAAFSPPDGSAVDAVLPARRAILGGRGFWLKHLHRWHWISAAVSLIGMVLFAATGITLNHAGDIESVPRVTTRSATLTPELLVGLPAFNGDGKHSMSRELRSWIGATFGVSAGDRLAEWSADEVYLPLPRPGGDGWLTIERESGLVTLEVTTRGWVSYLNDLHKGRNAGAAWSWFIDIFAGACLVFCLTGLVLLQFHARTRPATWPLVGVGLVAPLVLAILFIH